MQFHLEGFKAGDPRWSERLPSARRHTPDEALPENVDVLIVGCGPAGLTLAAQLAAFPDITTCIVDQKAGPLERGQADGVACRSMEMFNAFGFAGQVMEEAYWVNETTFWRPDTAQPNVITRQGRVQDVEDGLSEFPHVILNQARVHDYFLDAMLKSPARLQPDYSRRFSSLEVDENGRAESDCFPVSVTFERVDEAHAGTLEHIKARYVVGCDGARSAVRGAIGQTLRGDSANHAWGVMDVLAVTDFPDIRMKSLIRSASSGSILVIPREGGYLVRLYVELGKLGEDERVAQRDITVEQLISTANAILSPYTLDVKEVAWWSVYEIGQRLCDRFDDLPVGDATGLLPRVFIAGDACHTHSPKAGQGMNVSMRDTFNLGWKLAAVLQGQSSPQLLHTYTEERQRVAKTLIDFDREWSKIIASSAHTPDDTEEASARKAEFQSYFIQSGRYTAGTAIQYQASSIVGEPAYQHLAPALEIGTRFHSEQVVRLADAKPVHLGHTVRADGRWRLFLFADAPENNMPALHTLCSQLLSESQSPLQRYTPAGADIDSVFDVRALLQHSFRDIDISALPTLLRPAKGRHKLVDYEKVFCAHAEAGIDFFAARGIDRQHGCVVVVRPDQHVAHVLPLTGFEPLAAFFAKFMLPAA